MENSMIEQSVNQGISENIEEKKENLIQENQEKGSVENSNKNDVIDTHIKGVIEAILFISEKPVTLEQLKKVLSTVSGSDIKNTIQLLKETYEKQNSGMTIFEIAGGYQMLSNAQYASYIRDFYKTKHKERLSKPALESLAIIAYKQPVTRADIEIIRGVNSDGVVNHLLNKDLIKAVGRKEVPGRPFLYGTTKQFLEHFGLKSLSDLPKLEEFPTLLAKEEESEEVEIKDVRNKEDIKKVEEEVTQDKTLEQMQRAEEKLEELIHTEEKNNELE